MKYRAAAHRRKNRLEFDPNSKEAPQWATYIPRRNPPWKVHGKKGQACGAVSNCANSMGGGHPGIVYQYVGDRWVEFGRYEPVEVCAHCGKEAASSWNPGFTQLDNHPGKYQFEKPFVCRECYTAHFKPDACEPVDPRIVMIPR